MSQGVARHICLPKTAWPPTYGIESRVNGDTMFVPITSDLEIQFVEIDSLLPAANVYIAAANVDEDDDEFEAVLLSVG